jgi:hypothetical protein
MYRILLPLLFSTLAVAQVDTNTTSPIDVTLRLQAIYQTGNLSQYGGQAFGAVTHTSHGAITTLKSNFNHVTVNDFNIINDSWNFLRYERVTQGRLYPVTLIYLGAAKSFGIKRGLVASMGAGWKTPRVLEKPFLDVNFTIGYANMRYHEQVGINEPTSNLSISASVPVNSKGMFISWNGESYMTLSNSYSGLQNNLSLNAPIGKKTFLNISHQTIFNDHVDSGKQKTNTQLLLGIMIKP